MENFAVNTGVNKPGEEDLVNDGWTDLAKRIQKEFGIFREKNYLAKP